jgi:hypothetical protein
MSSILREKQYKSGTEQKYFSKYSQNEMDFKQDYALKNSPQGSSHTAGGERERERDRQRNRE